MAMTQKKKSAKKKRLSPLARLGAKLMARDKKREMGSKGAAR